MSTWEPCGAGRRDPPAVGPGFEADPDRLGPAADLRVIGAEPGDDAAGERVGALHREQGRPDEEGERHHRRHRVARQAEDERARRRDAEVGRLPGPQGHAPEAPARRRGTRAPAGRDRARRRRRPRRSRAHHPRAPARSPRGSFRGRRRSPRPSRPPRRRRRPAAAPRRRSSRGSGPGRSSRSGSTSSSPVSSTETRGRRAQTGSATPPAASAPSSAAPIRVPASTTTAPAARSSPLRRTLLPGGTSARIDDPTVVRLGVLDPDHGIGPAGDHRPGRDRDRLAGGKARGGRVAGPRFADDPQRARGLRARAAAVGRADRVPVHGRVVEARDGDPGARRLGQDPAARRAQRQPLRTEWARRARGPVPAPLRSRSMALPAPSASSGSSSIAARLVP